jgi:hypothetical protein
MSDGEMAKATWDDRTAAETARTPSRRSMVAGVTEDVDVRVARVNVGEREDVKLLDDGNVNGSDYQRKEAQGIGS